MALSDILQNIQKKGQLRSTLTLNATASGNVSSQPQAQARERTVDPVVARLKAARKAEREQKEKELREKKGLKPKAAAAPRAPKTPQPRTATAPKNSKTLPKGAPLPRGPPAEKKPKVSFSELMKKASSIDQSKLSIAIKQKSKSPDSMPPRRAKSATRPGPGSVGEPRSSKLQHSTMKRNQTGVERKMERKLQGATRPPIPLKKPSAHMESQHATRAPVPIRQPSAQLQLRLKKKNPREEDHRSRYEEEDESDLDSFIASDEEEEVAVDYDRNEIWSIFNRGKKRTYYEDDYDSDDMEATGAEILAEEDSSKRRAMEEDRRELEEEQRLAALKRSRKGR